MAALFGEGLHPNAVEIINYKLARGAHHRVAVETAQLGRPFTIRSGETEFQRALAVAYREHNAASGQRWNSPIPDDIRARLRTMLARERFADEYGREPADDRELSGYIARNTRARTTAVAGYDITYKTSAGVAAPRRALRPRQSKPRRRPGTRVPDSTARAERRPETGTTRRRQKQQTHPATRHLFPPPGGGFE